MCCYCNVYCLIPVNKMISWNLIFDLSKPILFMCAFVYISISIERSSFMERYFERTSFMETIRTFMETIRAFMEAIRAFMENIYGYAHMCRV